jgi:hypothetical protein
MGILPIRQRIVNSLTEDRTTESEIGSQTNGSSDSGTPAERDLPAAARTRGCRASTQVIAGPRLELHVSSGSTGNIRNRLRVLAQEPAHVRAQPGRARTSLESRRTRHLVEFLGVRTRHPSDGRVVDDLQPRCALRLLPDPLQNSAPRPRWHRSLLRALGVGLVILCSTGCDQKVAEVPAEVSDAVPLRDTGHPVVLALSPDARAIEPALAATEREWVGLLTRAFGACDRLDLREIEADPVGRLAGRRVLVLPRASLQNASAQFLDDLEAAVEAGLTVLGERPDTNTARTFGVRVAAVERTPLLAWPLGDVPRVAGGRVEPPAWAPRPVSHAHVIARFAPGEDPRRRAHVVADVGPRPAIWSLERGSGAWVALAHELSEWTRRWRSSGATRPVDASDTPWIEAWLAFLIDRAAVVSPWPRFAAHPPGDQHWAEVDSASVPEVSEYTRWSRARENSRLRWSFENDALTVEIDVDPQAQEGLVLRLPRHWGTRLLVDWVADWSPSPAVVTESLGIPVLDLRVQAGVNGRVYARYR